MVLEGIVNWIIEVGGWPTIHFTWELHEIYGLQVEEEFFISAKMESRKSYENYDKMRSFEIVPSSTAIE